MPSPERGGDNKMDHCVSVLHKLCIYKKSGRLSPLSGRSAQIFSKNKVSTSKNSNLPKSHDTFKIMTSHVGDTVFLGGIQFIGLGLV